MLLPEDSNILSFFAKNAVRYTTAAWLGRSVLHGFCIRTYMFVSFFGQKRGSLYYGRMAWGIRYGSLGAWDLRFGRLRYTTASNARFRFKNLNYGSS